MPRRGGGSLGGGSRSHSRGSRSSSYHRRHYRRGYYGPYGPYYRNTYVVGPFGSSLILLFFLMIPVLIFSSMFGTTSERQFILTENATYAEDSGRAISIQATIGTINTYEFDDTPPLNLKVSSSASYPGETLFTGDYHSFDLYMNTGSSITINFVANGYVTVYVIKGINSFNSWKDGDSTEEVSRYGLNDTFTYTTTDSDEYYIAIYNENVNSVIYSLNLSYDLTTHDVSNGEDLGASISQMKLNGKTVVVKNTGTEDAWVKIIYHPRFQSRDIFLVLFVVAVAIVVLSYSRRKQNYENRMGARNQLQAQPPMQSPNSVLAQPTNTGYYQRPNPMYCPTCGSAIILGNKFCNACGAKL